MTERNKKFRELIYQDIEKHKLRVALSRIRAFSKEVGLLEVYKNAVELERRYYYMLQSMSSGNPDPNQNKEIAKMLDTALELGEKAFIEANKIEGVRLYDSLSKYISLRYEEENIPSLSVDYLNEHSSLMSNPEAFLDASKRKTLERIFKDIFNHLWAEFPLSNESTEAIINLINTRDIPLSDRIAWTNAIGLGMLENYDNNRFKLLSLLSSSSIPEVRVSAISFIFFFLHKKQSYNLSSDLVALWNRLCANESFVRELKEVIFEYARQLGTSALATYTEEEIIPKFQSFGSEMMSKFRELNPESKTPEEIEEILSSLSSSGLSSPADGLRDLNEKAEEGDDVFFAFFKPMHFLPFFNEASNWWIPFDTARSELKDIFEDEGALLSELFEQLFYLCDSDKYAVLTAVAMSPSPMRKQTIAMMAKQYGMIAEHLPNPKSGDDAEFHIALSAFMKNAFRFYMLFRRKGEFYNPFAPKVGINSSPEISGLYTDIDSTLKIAERLYKSGIKPFAYPFFNALIESSNDFPDSLFFKAAETAEMTGNIEKAKEYLKYYIPRNPSDTKALFKYLSLNRVSRNDSEALDLIEQSGGIELENVDLLAEYSRLLIAQGKYSEAAAIADKILYSENTHAPNTAKVLKARALLFDGNPLEAIEIVNELIPGETSTFDWFDSKIIGGMAYLVSNQSEKAFQEFRAFMQTNDLEKTYNYIDKSLSDAAPILNEVYDLSPYEINGMLDALKYSFNQPRF